MRPLLLLSMLVSYATLTTICHADDLTAQAEVIKGLMLGTWHDKLIEPYESFFGGASSEELTELKQHPNPGIAIRAAWELVQRESPVDDEKWQEIPQPVMQRFLGFVEGRLRVEIPKFWENSLLASKSRPSSQQFAGLTILPGRLPDEQYPIQSGVTVAEDGSYVIKTYPADGKIAEEYAAKTHELVQLIPTDYFKELDSNFGGVFYLTHASTSAGSVLIAYDSFGVFPIFALSNEGEGQKQIRWTQEVRGEGILPMGRSGLWYHDPLILESNDMILVFGVLTLSAYIESFSPEDGSVLFRFSTSY